MRQGVESHRLPRVVPDEDVAARLNPVGDRRHHLRGEAHGALDRLGQLGAPSRSALARCRASSARIAAGRPRTRAVVEAMRADEARHRDSALALGAAELPAPVKRAMRVARR